MPQLSIPPSDRLLTLRETAALFGMKPESVTRNARIGRISFIRTPGGHRRFSEAEVRALMAGDAPPPAPDGRCDGCGYKTERCNCEAERLIASVRAAS
jgi:excisionase family DNA binding protein